MRKGLTWGSYFLMGVVTAMVILAVALTDPLWWVDEELQNSEFVVEVQNCVDVEGIFRALKGLQNEEKYLKKLLIL